MSIGLDTMRFLQKLKPYYRVVVCRRASDGEAFVCRPQIMHIIPLGYFTEK